MILNKYNALLRLNVGQNPTFCIIMAVKFPFSKTYLSLLFLCPENIISMISLHHILLKNKWYPPNEPSTTAVFIRKIPISGLLPHSNNTIIEEFFQHTSTLSTL
jgi:hypothetical protein